MLLNDIGLLISVRHRWLCPSAAGILALGSPRSSKLPVTPDFSSATDLEGAVIDEVVEGLRGRVYVSHAAGVSLPCRAREHGRL
jgi:hypothetical protein